MSPMLTAPEPNRKPAMPEPPAPSAPPERPAEPALGWRDSGTKMEGRHEGMAIADAMSYLDICFDRGDDRAAERFIRVLVHRYWPDGEFVTRRGQYRMSDDEISRIISGMNEDKS